MTYRLAVEISKEWNTTHWWKLGENVGKTLNYINKYIFGSMRLLQLLKRCGFGHFD